MTEQPHPQNERQQADALEEFLMQNASAAPQSPEQALAKALLQSAEESRLPATFHTEMQTVIQALAAEEGAKVIPLPRAAKPASTARRARLPLPSPTLTMVAAVLLAFIGIMIVLLPSNGPAPLQSTLIQQPPVPLRNPLPIMLGAHITGFDNAEEAALDQAGITWVAYTVRYEPDNAEALLAEVEAIRTEVYEQGRSLMVTVEEGFSGLDGIVDFTVALAESSVDAIEFLPEANISRDETLPLQPEDYVELVGQIHEQLVASPFDPMLIAGAPAPTGAEDEFYNVLNNDTYYRRMAAAGIDAYVGCIGVAYTEALVAPDAISGDPRDDYHTRYLPTMLLNTRQYFPETPLCLTQIGMNITARPQFVFEWADDLTPEEQATWTALMVMAVDDLATDYDLEIPLTVLYRLTITPNATTPMGAFLAGWDLLDEDGNCIACAAISELRDDRDVSSE